MDGADVGRWWKVSVFERRRRRCGGGGSWSRHGGVCRQLIDKELHVVNYGCSVSTFVCLHGLAVFWFSDVLEMVEVVVVVDACSLASVSRRR